MPRLAVAALLLVLVALAATSTYAGYLVVGMVADYLGTGRFLAGLLLGVLFLRLPRIRNGQFQSVGLLPKPARLPVVLALLTACLALHLQQRDLVPVVFLGLAAGLLLSFRWLRQSLARRVASFVSRPGRASAQDHKADPTILDVEFREKKD